MIRSRAFALLAPALAGCGALCVSALAPDARAGGWDYLSIGAQNGYTTALRLDPAGRAHVAFTVGALGVQYAQFDGGGWRVEPVPALAADSEPVAGSLRQAPHRTQLLVVTYLSLALGPDDTPWLAQATLDGTSPGAPRGVVQVSHRDPATGTWAPESLGEPAYGPPSLAVDAAGRVHVVFRTVDGVHYAWRKGGEWSSEVLDVSPDPLPQDELSLALDAAGRPVVAIARPFDRPGLFVARRGPIAWEVHPIDDSRPARAPSLAFDAVGRARIAALQPGAAAPLVLAEELTPGGAWSVAPVVAGGTSPTAPSLSVGPGGAVRIGIGDAAGPGVWALTRIGEAWSRELVDPAGQQAPWLAMDLDATGRPWFAYDVVAGGGMRLARPAAAVAAQPGAGGPWARDGGLALGAIAPNPVAPGRTVRLWLAGAEGEAVSLALYDVAGRMRARAPAQPLPDGAGWLAVPVPADGLPAGVLFVRAATQSGRQATGRFVVLD